MQSLPCNSLSLILWGQLFFGVDHRGIGISCAGQVMGEQSVILCAGHIHHEVGRHKPQQLRTFVSAFAGAIKRHGARLCGIDANMALFELSELMRKCGVQFDLAAHHVEYKREWRPVHNLHHAEVLRASARFERELWVHSEALWDSMGLFLIGPNSGTLSCGVARHAVAGAAWPRVDWEKTYSCGFPNHSYRSLVPTHLVKAMQDKGLLEACRKVARHLKPVARCLQLEKKKARAYQVSMPHPL